MISTLNRTYRNSNTLEGAIQIKFEVHVLSFHYRMTCV